MQSKVNNACGILVIYPLSSVGLLFRVGSGHKAGIFVPTLESAWS